MVAPSVPGTLLTPIAPHSLSFRPLVVPESSEIEIHLPPSARSHARQASFGLLQDFGLAITDAFTLCIGVGPACISECASCSGLAD